MVEIPEFDIELLAIQHLESLGYQYLYGPEIAPDALTSTAIGAFLEDIRDSFKQVLLLTRLNFEYALDTCFRTRQSHKKAPKNESLELLYRLGAVVFSRRYSADKIRDTLNPET